MVGQRRDDAEAGKASGFVIDDAALPADLVQVDRLLAEIAGPILVGAAVPDGLASRIYEASYVELPTPVLARVAPATSARVRFARFAVAAAVVLAALCGSLVFVETGGVDTEALAQARRPTPNPEAPRAAEATLVALLAPSTGYWVDEQSFTSSAGRAVAPILQTRNAAIDDFAQELNGMFGDDDSHSM